MILNLDPAWRRTIMALAYAAAGVPLTIFSVWMVWIIWRGGWSLGTETLRLNILGTALYGVLTLVGLVLTGMAFTVGLRQLKVDGPGGVGVDIGGGGQ